MECPKCRQHNLPGSSYCEKCGFHLKSLQRQPPRHAPSSYAPPTPAVRPVPAPAPRPSAGAPPPQAAPPPPLPAPVSPPRAPMGRPPISRAELQPAPTQPPAPVRPTEPPPYATLRELPQGRQLELRWDRTLVGRQSAADQIFPELDLSVYPDNSGVSRRHAQIQRLEGQVVLEDLGSANGTFLNGNRLVPGAEHPVRHQDEVRFGSLRFQYWQP